MRSKTDTPHSAARRQTTTPRAAGPTAALKAEPPLPNANSGPRPGGKLGVIFDLLHRREGAKLSELMAATEWQAHTVRGAVSGTMKSRLRLPVVSELTADGRRYRLGKAGS